MTQVTMDISDELAMQIRPIQHYLPTIIELSLLRCKTLAARSVSELIEFLTGNPTSQQLLKYHVSAEQQARTQRLLALNQAGLASEAEQQELDELEAIEHIIVMVKTTIAQQLSPADQL